MDLYDRQQVVSNYYKASSALMEIGTTKNIPEELLQLSLNASREVVKIIDYINTHREKEVLELMNYEGCGRCEKCGKEFDCKAHRVPVMIKFNKAQKWDNCGRMVTAFTKDDVVQGEAVIEGNKVYCAAATSTVYTDIDDFIALEDVEITR